MADEVGDVLGKVVALGLIGFDPTGAVLLVGAIAARASRTKVFAFTAAVLITSVVTGTALAIVGNRVFGDYEFIASGPVRAYIEVATALALVVWLAGNLKTTSADAPSRRNIAQSTPAMTIGGVVFALTTVLDPSFPATAVLVGPSGAFVSLTSFVIRTVMVHIALIALVVAFIFGVHERPVDATRRWYERHKKLLIRLLNATLFLCIAVLLADAGKYFTTGHYVFTL